ncbi:hypothetical protein MUN82_10220 [Hymenobacter aerilatus]|uniref:Uncharacterized protein n=1 Tax=Hymenobacter aerilatus TaxID=2932251 RepID=A0A8T9SYX3_9BACT|nr:hypothetical protein [Hymenobacter aerilatus]UOR07452.1 hypothetical protein MUN82_10220 [Hymenobacter aerilatus]
MKLSNFTIKSFTELEWPNGGYADLHNDFLSNQLAYKPQAASLVLFWTKSTGEWAKQVQIASLKIVFTNVNFLRVREREAAYPLSEDECLSEIGWSPPDEKDNFDSFYPDQNAPSTYDLLIGFHSEWAIKLNADNAQLFIETL